MTYSELFAKVRELFAHADVSHIGEHLAFQFNITGEAEGAFYAEVKDGKLYVEPYEYYDRDVIFTCTADTLLKLAAGQTDAVLAYTPGKLKVHGDIGQPLKLRELVANTREVAGRWR